MQKLLSQECECVPVAMLFADTAAFYILPAQQAFFYGHPCSGVVPGTLTF
jgi:hypothetical protein